MPKFLKTIALSLAIILCLAGPVFGVGTWSYTETTNIVQVTQGTEIAPCTFADFVTADRAGTGTILLSAGTPAADLALTYAVRPVEDLAVLVKCVVANKTAEADFIFITGTDWRGAAQTESIDVTAGNGSYTTTLYWASITTLDCSDNAAGGGNVWADGDLSVTQDIWAVIWDLGNGQYQVDAIFNIGNNTTTTYFQSKNEDVYLTKPFYFKSAATLTLGEEVYGWSENGSHWRVAPGATWAAPTAASTTATINVYGSILEVTETYQLNWNGGVIVSKNSIWSGSWTTGWLGPCYFGASVSSLSISDVYFVNFMRVGFYKNPDVFNRVQIHTNWKGLFSSGVSPTISNLLVTNSSGSKVNAAGGGIVTLVDPEWVMVQADITNDTATNGTKEAWSCNIHVADKDGNNLPGVSIVIKDTSDNIVTYGDSGANCSEFVDLTESGIDVTDGTKFTANDIIRINSEFMLVNSIAGNTLTVTRGYYTNYEEQHHMFGNDIYICQAMTTDVNGDINEIQLQRHQWYGTSETETDYSPHTFTISKAGYKTLVLDNVTVDALVAWHLELQPIEMAPAPFGVSWQVADDYWVQKVVGM